MKRILTILLLGFILQTNGQNIHVELYFIDDCSGKIESLEYELYDIENKQDFYSEKSIIMLENPGVYVLQSIVESEDYFSLFSTILEIKNKHVFIDTLPIPKIRFTFKQALRSQYWNYFNCANLCNGKEIDFYQNGNKRLEGEFINGKPIMISEFRNDGSIQTKSWYKFGFMSYEKVEHYDFDGKLETYEVFKNRKRKTIKRIFNNNGDYLEKEIQIHQIEK